MDNKKNIFFLGKIINILGTIIFFIITISVVSLMIQKIAIKEKVPDIFGYKILQVMSGSMSGEFETGDTILIKKIKNESDLREGDIITYKISENVLVTHRIVNITKIGEKLNYTTKGDSNNIEDEEKIQFSSIEGIYVKKLNLIGKLITFMQKPYGMVIVFVFPILLIIFIINNEKIKQDKKTKRREKRLIYEMKYTKEQSGEEQNEKK